MSKAILFNAPAKAGKDVAISFLKNEGYPLVIRECKGHLHKLTQLFFRVNEDRYWEIYNDRNFKEKPMPEFSITLNDDELKKLEAILGHSISDR